MAKAPTFSATKKGYENLYNSMKFTRSTAINAAARKIIANKDSYKKVENATGVPWYWVGAIHMRESNNNFQGVLHNGERIIGTGRKTVLEPDGRGPFSSWHEAAIDAIKLKKLQNIKDWSIPRQLFEAERYNGWGYTWRGVNSPYVWGGTNHQQRGKYIRDGVWSSTATDQQLGVAPVIYKVRELENIGTGISTVGGRSDSDVTTGSSPDTSRSHWFIRLLKFIFTK